MLIKVSIENWMSFRDRVEFSMIATRERQHRERLAHVPSHRLKILPIALLYGGNASGKSNFMKALHFAQNLVVTGSQPDAPIPTDPFRLDDKGETKPTRFEFEILTTDGIYEYSFSVTSRSVTEERLVKIGPTSEQVLYHRIDDSPNWHKSLQNNTRMQIVFEGTQSNKLFLTNSVSQKIEYFRPIYDWFRNTLTYIAPDSRYIPHERLLNQKDPLHGNMTTLLPKLDTGIVDLGGEEIEFKNVPLDQDDRLRIEKELTEGRSIRILSEASNDRFIVSRVNGQLKSKKLFSYHTKRDGKKVRFEIGRESDGSQRLIDLLPAFFEPSEPERMGVTAIDEIDRSLHTLLTRQLIELFLQGCGPDSRKQLIITTHDVLLMDQDLFRRDEIWVSERDRMGASTLIPFSDFKDVRYDKDLQKSYVQGRLGGIPRLLAHIPVESSKRNRG